MTLESHSATKMLWWRYIWDSKRAVLLNPGSFKRLQTHLTTFLQSLASVCIQESFICSCSEVKLPFCWIQLPTSWIANIAVSQWTTLAILGACRITLQRVSLLQSQVPPVFFIQLHNWSRLHAEHVSGNVPCSVLNLDTTRQNCLWFCLLDSI